MTCMRMSPSTPHPKFFCLFRFLMPSRIGWPGAHSLCMRVFFSPLPANQGENAQWLGVTKRNQRGRLQITRCSSLLGGLILELDSSVFNNRGGVRLAVAFLGEACRCRAGPCSSTPRPRPHGLGDFLFFPLKALSSFVWPSVNIFHDLLFACRHCRATSVRYDGIQRVWE